MKNCLAICDRFLHDSCDPRVVPILRIGFAAFVLIHIAVLWPYADLWFTEQGVMTAETAQAIRGDSGWSILFWLPNTVPVVRGCLLVMASHCVLMLFGLGSRFQIACLFIWLISFQNRNPLILDGEDKLMRLFAFFLIWLPLDDRWSLRQFWRKGAAGKVGNGSPWALRLIQFQLIAIYASTSMCKLQGSTWHDGTAMWHVARMTDNFGRLCPAAIFDIYWVSAFATWSALLLELLLPILLAVPQTRKIGILAGICLHLGIELSMNLFLFQWLMILGLISFVRFSDWKFGRLVWAENTSSLARDPQHTNALK